MRLTNKLANGKGYTYKYNGFGCFDKLGQLEDIEDELGIDLVTLFKALKNGVTNYNGGLKWYVALAYNKIRDEYYLYYNFGGGYSKTRDYDIEYGWALAKEELL